MDGQITVEINGIEIKLPERSTLGDAIRVSGSPYQEGVSVGY